MKAFVIVILNIVLAFTIIAQNKTAIINTDAFYDEKTGISELVIINKNLKEKFTPLRKELETKVEKINKLQKELEESSSKCRIECPSQEWIKEKLDERDKLAKEIELKSNEAKRIFTDSEKPIVKRIIEKLEIFKKNKGYFLIVEQSSTDNGVVICDEDNITNEFIKFCNEEFEKEKIEKQ